MENFKNVLKHKYADFSGRASRKEYWMFVLFSLIFSIAFSILDGILGFKLAKEPDMGALNLVFNLAILIPSIAILVRRLHDTNRSPWWLFILLVPFVGVIVILVFLIQDSTPIVNKYGPNPNETTPPTPPAPDLTIPTSSAQ
jgi:uncharacterized membrane protein YhaH (DUF805 family)